MWRKSVCYFLACGKDQLWVNLGHEIFDIVTFHSAMHTHPEAPEMSSLNPPHHQHTLSPSTFHCSLLALIRGWDFATLRQFGEPSEPTQVALIASWGRGRTIRTVTSPASIQKAILKCDSNHIRCCLQSFCGSPLPAQRWPARPFMVWPPSALQPHLRLPSTVFSAFPLHQTLLVPPAH